MKTFLNNEQKIRFDQLLTPPLAVPSGEVFEDFVFTHQPAHWFLSQVVEESLRLHPLFKKVEVVLLGSLARNELCPLSDIDLLFLGDPGDVKKITADFNERGWPLRYRMPENESDWSIGVQIFDILALLKARPLTSRAAKELLGQRQKIWAKRKILRKQVLHSLQKERLEREKRFASMTNYLEPNIKFGPGGLRDLEQGLQILQLYPEKFQEAHHAKEVLKYCKLFFLSLRCKLHMLGQKEILNASSQFEIAEWMGFSSHKEFMSALQKSLSRVHFYSSWILESAGQVRPLSQRAPKNIAESIRILQKDPSLLAQQLVRSHMDSFEKKSSFRPQDRVQMLTPLLAARGSEKVLRAVFDSRLMQQIIPQFSRLVGYVQHDQYHRYTADAHILNACVTVQRVYKKPSLLLDLQGLVRHFKPQDWTILGWTALYHDMGKGHGMAEKHGLKSRELFRQHVRAGFSKSIADEIEWLIVHHLELSEGAFRKNSQDRLTWQNYSHLSQSRERLHRLAVFTAIDIIATNPEAWSEWKAQLIHSLVEKLSSVEVKEFVEFRNSLKKVKYDFETLSEKIDLTVLKDLGVKNIVKDLLKCLDFKTESFNVMKGKSGAIFLRYHNPIDQNGLLLNVLSRLFNLGISVKMASVITFSDQVYDLFLLQTNKSKEVIEKLLRAKNEKNLDPIHIQLQNFNLSTKQNGYFDLYIEALDQRGLFLSLVQTLESIGASIERAEIHTWGRKVEDLIVFRTAKSREEILNSLNEKWQCTPSSLPLKNL